MKFVDYKCLESLIIEGEGMITTEGFFGDFANALGSTIGEQLVLIFKAIVRALKNLKNRLLSLIASKSAKPLDPEVNPIDQTNVFLGIFKRIEEFYNKIGPNSGSNYDLMSDLENLPADIKSRFDNVKNINDEFGYVVVISSDGFKTIHDGVKRINKTIDKLIVHYESGIKRFEKEKPSDEFANEINQGVIQTFNNLLKDYSYIEKALAEFSEVFYNTPVVKK